METIIKDVKSVMKDVENFLTAVLKKEKLSKDATKKKEELISKVSGLRTKIDSEEKEKIQTDMKSNAVVPEEPEEEYQDVDVPEPEKSADTISEEGIMDDIYEEAGSSDLVELATAKSESGPNVETDSMADDNKSVDELCVYDESARLNIKPTAANDLEAPIKTGFLEKKRKEGQIGFSTWQKRWCVIKDNFLYYYNKPNDKKQKNVVHLVGYEGKHAPQCAEKKKKDTCFEITHTEHRAFQFVAPSKQEMDEWIEAIHKASNQVNEPDSEPLPLEEEGEMYEDVAQPIVASDDVYEIPEEDLKPKEKKPVPIEPNKSVLFNEILPKEEEKKKEVVTKTTVAVMQCSNWEYDYNEIYVAMWDCKGSQSDELSFKRGEFVHIINKLDDFADHKWWIGETKDRVGFLPKEYVMKAYDLDI